MQKNEDKLEYFVFPFLQLRDGNSADSPELGKFCGVTIPQPVRTSSNQLRVEFHSDNSMTGRGFRMNWQSNSGTDLMPDVSTLPTPVVQSRFAYVLMYFLLLLEMQCCGTIIINSLTKLFSV